MSHENPENSAQENQMFSPEELQKIREYEDREIQELVEKIKSTTDLENPPRNLIFTAMEHKLIGSTTPGRGFHPNAPLAHFLGVALERINEMREKYSGKEGISGFLAEIDLDSKKWIEFVAKLKPLTQEIIDTEDPTPTIEVAKINASYDDSVTSLDDTELKKKMDAAQVDRRQGIKDELEKPDDPANV